MADIAFRSRRSRSSAESRACRQIVHATLRICVQRRLLRHSEVILDTISTSLLAHELYSDAG